MNIAIAVLALILPAAGPAPLAVSPTSEAHPPRALRDPTGRVALVIGNNRSLDARRPDLRYADDDALKFAELLREHDPDTRVIVLTRVDDDSSRLFPTTPIDGPPASANLEEVVTDLATQAQGRRLEDFMLIFAGHGGQKGGKGWLELEDRPLDGEGLRSLIQRVGAKRTHVILDACNSFFVVNARRPGGKSWATSADAGLGLSVPGQEVGVFLSTSPEAETFEWSQLQSGIFSHLVRSGLRGGADFNQDGAVSYLELEGFVELAAQGLNNETYRPHLFVAPPAPSANLLTPAAASARRAQVTSDTRRLTLRNAGGVRLADFHLEDGFAPWVILPPGEVTATGVRQVAGRGQNIEWPVQGAVIDDGTADPARLSSRGPGTVLEALFATGFGPTAFAGWKTSHEASPPKVYGVTRAQEERLLAQLEVFADASLRLRVVAISTIAVAGTISMLGATVGALYFWAPHFQPGNLLPNGPLGLVDGPAIYGFSLATGAVSIGVASLISLTWTLLSPGPLEEIRGELEDGEYAGSRDARVARLLSRVQEEIEEDEVSEDLDSALTLGVLGLAGLFSLSAAAGATAAFIWLPHDVFLWGALATASLAMLALGALVSISWIVDRFIPPTSPAEQLLEVVRSDPDAIDEDLLSSTME